ncbi:MAG TPA: HAMP domain-containing protein [Candidatus Omnitrophica bacterium]|nr:HAMP domain-containing protein [Candidatus Omnitrophota bacterium]
MQFNSIRFKASVFYSTILAVILVVFGTIIYISTSYILYRDLNHDLKIKAEEISTILHVYEEVRQFESHPSGYTLGIFRKGESGSINEKAIIDDLWRKEFNLLNLKNDYINVVNINGVFLLTSNNFTEDIASLFREQFPFSLEKTVYKSVVAGKIKLQVINLPVSYYSSRLAIQVATPLEPVTKELGSILFFIIISALSLLILTSFAGGILTRAILQPVMDVSNLADKITHKDLTLRVQEQQTDEEMRHLVSSFNAMIGRLEKSFSHINEFSSYVAHELKTPLAIIKGEMELALRQERNSEEYKNVLEGCLEETDRIIRIIRDLHLLAKLDYKPDIFKFEKFNIVQFLNEIYEHSKVLSSSKNIEVKLNVPKKDIFINGDTIHLRRLFLNLINNAVKFTPQKGEIDISIAIKDSNVCIDITDTGEGISEENLPKIFDKFYRIHKEELASESGTGLGLNIALTIARVHNGDIKVKSRLRQGTTFTVVLPLA